MDNIGQKEYEYVKRVILKDGTIKEYKSKKKYTPVIKVKKSKLLETIRSITNENSLRKIETLVNEILENERLTETPSDNGGD